MGHQRAQVFGDRCFLPPRRFLQALYAQDAVQHIAAPFLRERFPSDLESRGHFAHRRLPAVIVFQEAVFMPSSRGVSPEAAAALRIDLCAAAGEVAVKQGF